MCASSPRREVRKKVEGQTENSQIAKTCYSCEKTINNYISDVAQVHVYVHIATYTYNIHCQFKFKLKYRMCMCMCVYIQLMFVLCLTVGNLLEWVISHLQTN